MEKERAVYVPENTTSCVKHGGDSIMVWSCRTGKLVFDDVTAN